MSGRRLRTVTLPPVVKHAWDRGQPAPGIGAMTAPHAARGERDGRAALRQNARRAGGPTFHCRGGRCGEIACLLNFLALLPRLLGLYL